MDKFSERLCELRVNTGLSQAAFGEKIGLSRNSIYNYENGKRTPSLDDLIKIANFFNVSYDYLLGKSDSKYRENADIAAQTGLSDNTIKRLRMHKQMKDYIEQRFGKYVYTELDTINSLLEPGEGEALITCIDNFINSDFDGSIMFIPKDGEPLNAAISGAISVPKRRKGITSDFKVDTQEMLDAWFSKKVITLLSKLKETQQVNDPDKNQTPSAQIKTIKLDFHNSSNS